MSRDGLAYGFCCDISTFNGPRTPHRKILTDDDLMACTRRTIFLLLVIHTVRDVHARVMTMHSYLACNISPLMIYIRAPRTMTSSPKLPALSMQLHLRACHAPLDVQRKKQASYTSQPKQKHKHIHGHMYVCVHEGMYMSSHICI